MGLMATLLDIEELQKVLLNDVALESAKNILTATENLELGKRTWTVL